MPSTLLASLLPLCTLLQNTKWQNDTWPALQRLIIEFMKVQGMKTWKEVTTGVQHLVSLLFNNNFINPGLVL